MPGPFPGMDPYLEDPGGWPGVHNALITYLWRALKAILPPEYTARMEERCYIVHPDRQVIPDLTVTVRARPTATATAVSEADAPLILKLLPFEIREMFIDVVTLRERSRVVTTLELLSPTNKAAGTEGRRLYREKQAAILASRTHLIEIDLLRQGEHTVAAPKEPLLYEGRWDYIACLHRGGQTDAIEAWPKTLRQRLPRIYLPLDPGDADVVLDLQAVLDAYYDDGNYRREIDYSQPPVPPLRSEDATWSDELLRAAGLLPDA